MSHVLVVGGGLAGCTVAKELTQNNSSVNVTIVEKADAIGGKVRNYGCKATDVCNNCGVCLSSGIWDEVANQSNIKILTDSTLVDLIGEKGNFTAAIKGAQGINYITGLTEIVVTTGFGKKSMTESNAFIETTGKKGIITGSELEKMLQDRTSDSALGISPKSVAFIQCFGSRDKKENSNYCSKVCCAYSTRAAKVMKKVNPDCDITFFYMEMQPVNVGDYYKSLTDLGINFIKCRPVKIKSGEPAAVIYDEPNTGEKVTKEFDLIVLSDGIHPQDDSNTIAEICGLGQNEYGFFTYVKPGKDSGIYLAGCAKGPEKIEETYADSVAVAKDILFA